jgi:CheY-like chemotaxis protein
MGGRIGCDAGPGSRGSLLWVELPLEEAMEVQPRTTAWNPSHGPIADDASATPRRRVLVVDDVTANRLVARVLLQGAGHRVEQAVDGAGAIEAVRQGNIDLVLMDVQMPGMDGLEATRRIRALEGPGRHIPIIALTADALRDQIEQCLAAGMDGHLTKPLDRAALLAAVSHAGATAGAPLAEPVQG